MPGLAVSSPRRPPGRVWWHLTPAPTCSTDRLTGERDEANRVCGVWRPVELELEVGSKRSHGALSSLTRGGRLV